MQRYRSRLNLRLWSAAVASALSLGCVVLSATAQEAKPAATAPQPPGTKQLAFEFRDQPWERVLDWLADNSPNMPIAGTQRPHGTFNFVSPPGKKYTLPQIIDILNDSLISQKMLILRNPSRYTIVSTEDPQLIDKTILPNLTIDELEVDKPYEEQKLGRTELCQITFQLNSLSPDEAETNLASRKGPFGSIQKIPKAGMILVTDTTGNLRHMKKLLDKIDPTAPGGAFEVFQLRPTADGTSVENVLKTNWGLGPGLTPVPNAPKIIYDASKNQILFKGDANQTKEARDIMTKQGAIRPVAKVEPGTGGATTQVPAATEEPIRVVTLKEEHKASQLVDNLKYMLETLRANPIYVTLEPVLQQSLENSRKGIKPLTEPKKEGLNEPPPRIDLQDKPGNPNKPVFIASLSRTNGIMIGSDDPEALEFADQILAYLIKPGDENYDIIPLKYANAKIVVTTLDELINGKRQQGPQNPMMMMMGGGGRNLREELTEGKTVRLSADPRTNSILVRAPRQIIVTIRRFVETRLDVKNIDTDLQPRPRIRKLANAEAQSTADVLSVVYKDYMEERPQRGGMNPMQFNPFMQQQQQQAQERQIRFAVTANTRDNSLIMNCPDILWEEVDWLITQLDMVGEDTNKEVFVYTPKGKVDPQMLQRAMDVLTGKSTSTTDPGQGRSPMNRFGMGGFGPQGGFGNQGGGRQFGNGGGGGRGQGGGGMGGGNRGGGQRRGNRREEDRPPVLPPTVRESGGSDFFGDRVKEDPRTPVTPVQYATDNQTISDFQQIAFAENQTASAQQPPAAGNQPARPQQQPGSITQIRAPTGDVTVLVMPDGQIMIQGSKQDIEAVKGLIDIIVGQSPSADTTLELFDLKHSDATSITNQLNIILGRYNPVTRIVGAGGGTTPGGAPGGAGPFGGAQRPFGQGQFGQGQFGQGQFGQGQGFGQGLNQGLAATPGSITATQASGILILAVTRQNKLLIGAPKSAMDELRRIIGMLDQPNTQEATPQIFSLRRANAASVGATLQQFYQQRYGATEPTEIRIVPDVKLNALLVHAGPNDLTELKTLIDFFDREETKVINEVRIKELRNANATDLAALLQQALSQALLGGGPQTTPGAQSPFGNQFGAPFGGNQFGQQGLFGNQANRLGQQPGAFGTQQPDRRGISLTFGRPGQQRFETGLLDDVGIFADSRTNRLLISAPPQSIALLEQLIEQLDVPPTALADVKVFRLKNADATQAAQTLQSIYFGTQQTGARPAGQAAPVGGLFGNQANQQQMNFTMAAGQGPPPVAARFAVDPRSNSLIVAAGRGDMILIDALLNNLDAQQIRDRKYETIRLKNNQAGNVADRLTQFFNGELSVLANAGDLATYSLAEREVTVIPDATNNSILVGASPRYFDEVVRLINQLDVELAQVAIQVLIAQITMDNFDEFGVEVGLQSPVLFQRSLFTPPVATTSSTTPIGSPGFPFNNVSVPSANFANVNPSQVGVQSLTNYNLGRLNPTNGLGGFVFSASSESVSVLVRALRTQGRIEVLSRPQIVTRDLQQALISVGQQVPVINGSTITQGIIQPNIEQQQVGIILKVLPQISPEGKIVMRVEPQISSLSNSTVNLGNGILGTIIDQTIASTTLEAADGSTVAIGGLITKRDEKNQRSVPWLGDLPYLGALFRYRSNTKQRTELLILLTPHIIRSPLDYERVTIEESRRMSWFLPGVEAVHGPIPGASFLQQYGGQDCLRPEPMINPFDQNYMGTPAPTPAPTGAAPVDERLRAPQTTTPARPNVPAAPQPKPPSSTVPGWLQPPGVTPPPGNQQQLQAPPQTQYQPVNNQVSGLPPQRMSNLLPPPVPINTPIQQDQIGPWRTTVTYGPVMPSSAMTSTGQQVPVVKVPHETTTGGFAGQR